MVLAITLATILICAQLWRMGGNGYDLLRNPGVPIVLALVKLYLISLNSWSWTIWLTLLYIPALWGMIQAFSYGVNAPIHKFWVWVFGQGETGNYKPVEVATRSTCGFFWSIPAAIFAIVTGNWIYFAIYVVFLTIANGVQYLLFSDVEISERVVGASVATSLFV